MHGLRKETTVASLSRRFQLSHRQQSLASSHSKRMGGSQFCWGLLVLFELWKSLRADTLVSCHRLSSIIIRSNDAFLAGVVKDMQRKRSIALVFGYLHRHSIRVVLCISVLLGLLHSQNGVIELSPIILSSLLPFFLCKESMRHLNSIPLIAILEDFVSLSEASSLVSYGGVKARTIVRTATLLRLSRIRRATCWM